MGKDAAKETKEGIDVKELIRQLENFKRDMRTELRELKESVNYCSHTCDGVNDLRKDYAALREEIKQLISVNKTLTEENDRLSRRVDELEQYQRLNNLEIRGIAEEADAVKIVEKIGEVLEVSISEKDIDTCHWVPTPKPGVQNIVVRFVQRSKRNDLLSKARKKKLTCTDLELSSDRPLYINEHLTQRNKELLSAANLKKKEVDWKFVWTSNGRILARKDETSKVLRIASLDDLSKMTSLKQASR